jgi:hypothetical protein
MASGIRGANPIWAEFDLQGNLFDDTFYLFVLENTIPYLPAKIYHDPDLATAWSQPIQFLGNGTLPIDIYFEAGKTYRLEFRQGDTQSDPLIYEVNNYMPGGGGSSPVDTVSVPTSNQVTNPQFALYNLANPYTLSGTDPAPIEVAPGWVLNLAGTGTITIRQVPLNSATINPSNAPYALRLTMTGWTTDSVTLRQRFQQNGMLWANPAIIEDTPLVVSSTVTARLTGPPQSISADLVDSQNKTLGTVLFPTDAVVNEQWNEFTGHAQLPATTNSNTPPAAYIDYLLRLPSNIDIYLTSFQLVAQESIVEPAFQQDSINRQIDHTYNTAYPIVPVGTVIDYGGFITTATPVPAHYLLCDYSAVSRAKYNQLFQAITTTETVTLTSGLATFTVVNSAYYRLGMGLENAGIPANTIIIGISGTTITMSNNATITGPAVVRFFASNQTYTETVSLTNAVNTFTVADGTLYSNGMLLTGTFIAASTKITNIAVNTITMSNTATVPSQFGGQTPIVAPSLVSFYAVGNGDGSTTFNVYGLQDRVIAGSGGSLFGTGGLTGLASSGGASKRKQLIGEIPSHGHPGSFATLNGSAGGSIVPDGTHGTGGALNVGPLSIAAQGGGNPFSIVQSTTIMHKLIRFE